MSDLGEMIKDRVAGVNGSNPASGAKGKRSLAGMIIVLFLALMLGLGFYASSEPEVMPVPRDKSVTGYATTQSIINVADKLLHKNAGFISNDITPPFVLLDNMPSFEFGALVQVRDITRALRKDIARSQSQSREDVDIAKAEPLFNMSHTYIIFPASEDKYDEGIKALERYKERLLDSDEKNAQFYARADNLRNWLQDVETRLGSLSQRLSASVTHSRVNTDLAGDPDAQQSTPSFDEISVKTSFFERDDVFYEARGATWALIHFLRAVEVDFGDVLEKKNAIASLRQIIRELEACQDTVWSPMVLNGDFFGSFGFLANHSLVMANYISRANAAMIDLRSLLAQG